MFSDMVVLFLSTWAFLVVRERLFSFVDRKILCAVLPDLAAAPLVSPYHVIARHCLCRHKCTVQALVIATGVSRAV